MLCYYLSNIYIAIENFVEFATNNIKYREEKRWEGSGRVGPKASMLCHRYPKRPFQWNIQWLLIKDT